MHRVCLAILVAACTSSSSIDTADVTVYDACEPVALDTSALTMAQLASVQDAIAAWNAVGVTAPVVGAATPVLPIEFLPSGPGSYGLYDGDIVYISSDLSDPHQREVVIAHELGHALGLVHVSASTRSSVMNPGNLGTVPTADDAAAVAARWGCP
ncbi:MAG TPA: matrixin family metalloprotease [Kofleriaceae bacterium]|nr:matrixin family metalloprotease [Kofleriaceae bacterium]